MTTATMTGERAGTRTTPGPLRSLAAGSRAELLRLRKWPALWVMAGVWLLLDITFAYLFNYIAYATGSTSFANEGQPAGSLLADLMPEAIPRIFTGGMPMFGGALMLTLGALASGSGYGWGTWKTVMTQGPGRVTAFGGTLVALAGIVIAVVAATFVVDLGASVLIATLESQTIVWPALADVGQALGGGLLIFGMWTAAGVLIGVIARSPALAIGLGLVWSLVVENLLRGVSGLIGGLEYVTDVMPGTAAGSLSGALGATTEGEGGGAPGVLTVLDGTTATLLLSAYVVVFTLVSVVLLRRRDIT